MKILLLLLAVLITIGCEAQRDSVFSSQYPIYSGWVDSNAILHSITNPKWNLKVFDDNSTIVATMDSAHILTVYDSLATIKALIKSYGIKINGYNIIKPLKPKK